MGHIAEWVRTGPLKEVLQMLMALVVTQSTVTLNLFKCHAKLIIGVSLNDQTIKKLRHFMVI